MKFQRKIASIAILLASFLSGCGRRDGIERVYLTGEVTYGGQPLEVGQIRFVPIDGTDAPVTIERFEGGKYETATSQGVPVGRHRVEILAYTAENFANWPTGPGSRPIPQILPPKFNRQSELSIELSSGTDKLVRDFRLER